jgi:transposase-like protein
MCKQAPPSESGRPGVPRPGRACADSLTRLGEFEAAVERFGAYLEPHAVEGRGSGNSRNGSYPKSVTTEIGKVDLRVPRDRNGTFDPVTVRKGQRRLDGISRDTISRITDAIVEDMLAWQHRPLDRVYPVVLIDAIVVKIRDGQVANRPIYVAMGVNLDGERDVLGCWVGPSGGEGAKFWMSVLTELRNRGIHDTFIVCCDGLKGLPDAIRATWPLADVQLCVVHLVRSSLRYTSKKHWGQVCREMREIYTAPTLDAAQARFDEFAEQWRERYPAMIDTWKRAWDEFTPFLDFPVELRKIVYTTDEIVNASPRISWGSGVASGPPSPRRPVLVARRSPSRRRVAA